MKIKLWISTLLCMLLCICFMPTMVHAAGNATLTVDGVNALETSSGDGWQYDSTENTLTLDGYNGGNIIADNMDLKIMLVKGSKNIISSEEAYGISCLQAYDLHIVGAENSTLNIAAKEHVIYSKGNIVIEDLNMTAENTSRQSSTGAIGCVYTSKNLTVDGSILKIKTPGSPSMQMGFSSSGEAVIKDSNITVDAGMHGVVGFNGVKIDNTVLNISAGVAALQSSQGGIYLKSCTGDLTAQTAAIYAENKSQKSQTELTDCNLNLAAAYGVMTYSDIVVDNGSLKFDCTGLGIYAYSATYDVEAQFKGTAKTICSDNTPQLMEVRGSYAADNTVDVTGVILENTGNKATDRILLVGDMVFSSDESYSRNILIPEGSNVTVANDIIFDLSSAPSVIIEGTLINKGTLKFNGADTRNKGNIYNYGKIILADNKDIVNTGKIYSSCTNSFDLTPYAENGILFHANIVHMDAAAATPSTEGNIEYWYCKDCKKYFSDAAGTKEISFESTVIPMLKEPVADNTGITAPIGSGKDNPKTGDDSNIALWITVMLTAGAVLTGTALYSRRKKHNS